MIKCWEWQGLKWRPAPWARQPPEKPTTTGADFALKLTLMHVGRTLQPSFHPYEFVKKLPNPYLTLVFFRKNSPTLILPLYFSEKNHQPLFDLSSRTPKINLPFNWPLYLEHTFQRKIIWQVQINKPSKKIRVQELWKFRVKENLQKMQRWISCMNFNENH